MILLTLGLLSSCTVFAEILGPHYHRDVGVPAAQAIWNRESRQLAGGTPRIVGGLPSFPGEHPYFAGLLIALGSGQTSVCGATLVSSERLLTAAHCWRDAGQRALHLTAVLGSSTLFYGGTRLTTSNVTTHDDYNATTLWNDIAVAVIPSVASTRTVRPVPLVPATLQDSLAGRRALVTGFGRTSDSASITILQTLSDVFVTLMSNYECAAAYGSVVYAGVVCSSGAARRGPCAGDSGGPLTVQEDGSEVLVGVVSFGSSRGCQAGLPSGFTRVSHFLPWIRSRL